MLDGEPAGDLPPGDLAQLLGGSTVGIRASMARHTARPAAGLGLWTLLEPSDSTCVLVSLQSMSHTKPGISVPAIFQNMFIILHASVSQSSGTYIRKAGLLLDSVMCRVNSSIDSSVSGIMFAAVSSKPANMTSGVRGAMRADAVDSTRAKLALHRGLLENAPKSQTPLYLHHL